MEKVHAPNRQLSGLPAPAPFESHLCLQLGGDGTFFPRQSLSIKAGLCLPGQEECQSQTLLLRVSEKAPS